MWTWKQSTGELREPGGKLFAVGYSGAGAGKNNPEMQDVHGVGPIPRGKYTMSVVRDAAGAPCDYEGKKRPVIRLMPHAGNEMHGRAGFLVHGDSVHAPGTASQGCIILGPGTRNTLAASDDYILEVVE